MELISFEPHVHSNTFFSADRGKQNWSLCLLLVFSPYADFFLIGGQLSLIGSYFFY